MKAGTLSARALALKPSPTLAMTAKARKMNAQGLDVVSFAAGEPDFDTPKAVCDAAKNALDEGMTKYTPSSGTIQLKEAVCAKLARENGIETSPDHVVVSCGAKHSLYNALQVLLDPGDEVLLLAPYWMTYADQVRLADGIPVVIHPDQNGGPIPSLDSIRDRIGPKTRAIIINSPSNPSGAVLPPEVLQGIADLAVSHGFWVVSDEIYERLVYGVRIPSIATLGEEIARQTVVVNGCSKSYAMTGWRIGYAVAPVAIAQAMSNLQDQVTSNPTSFAQAGAIAALNLPPSVVEAMRKEFEQRRDLIVGLLKEAPQLRVPVPEGAFYAFPDVSAYLGESVSTDVALADFLLENARVATVPGSVFEGPGRLRLSYACSREDIVRGVERIREALSTL